MTYTKISNAPQGGEASAEFELDLRGYVSGIVLGMDWDHDDRTASWTSITFAGQGASLYWYTWDGWFDGYLDPGSYHATFTEWTGANQGHLSRSLDLAVSQGQASSITNVILDESGIPIPEISSYFVLILAAFTASLGGLYFVQRRRNRD
jgi:hypothetical protein